MPPQQPRRESAIVARRTAQFRRLPQGLTFFQIAQRLQISAALARVWATRLEYAVRLLPLGRPPIREARLGEIQQLPPNLTIKQVARRLKISSAAAQFWIHQASYKFLRAPGSGEKNRKVIASQWARTDWSLRDADIARMLGVSRERVRQIRARTGQPKSHRARQLHGRNSRRTGSKN